MDFATDSSWAIWLAWYCGVTTFVLGCLLMLQILALRLRQSLRQRRDTRFRAVWEPLMMQSLEELPAQVPPIRRQERAAFLALWNYLHESLRAEAKEQLNQLARLAGMHLVARRMLKHFSLGKRFSGMTTSGNLRESTAWDDLRQIMLDADPVVSLVAAKALMRIDATRATPILIQQLAERPDWPLAATAGLLKEAGADTISAPLIQAALQAPPAQAARLLRLFEIAHAGLALPAARQLLGQAEDTEIITGCLRLLNAPEDLAAIRQYLTDTRWPVRVQAARALGRSGTAQDEAGLLKALWDAEWWVRYRAAQSLVKLPSVNPARLKELSAAQVSAYGRDIIHQVLAEKGL